MPDPNANKTKRTKPGVDPFSAIRRFTIYHNPRCSKSREALDRLRKAGIEPKIVEYLKHPLKANELDALIKLMGAEPKDLVRKSEDRFLDLELDRKPPKTRATWIKILADNPVLIERPIVTNGIKAVLGRPPENVDKLL